MATLADLYMRVRPDVSRLGPELKAGGEKAAGPAGQAAGSQFGKRFGLAVAASAAAVAGIAARQIITGMRASINAARDLNETVSKSQVIFGRSGKAIQQWAANAATDMGQSTKAALDGASTFAIYGKQAGLAGAKLFNFSTDLTTLASDMASFSNTSPEEAILAIGAALRGENDPIEKYGVLLNEASLKQIALKKGIIDSTKNALTPQQRVLAVQAALFQQLGEKGSKTLGDFERTSGSLANQQRIAAAQTENLKAKIGQALLPVMTSFYVQVNTKLIPALNQLWARHGPQITAWLATASTRFGDLAAKLGQTDWAGIVNRGVGALRQLAPAIKELRDNAGTGFADTLRVGATVMKFAADNADLLAKALPYLTAALIVAKAAQLASNVATAASPFITLASAAANRRLATSIAANTVALQAQAATQAVETAATAAGTGAQNAGILARARAVAGMVAQRVAMVATRAATLAWVGAQWLLNVALTANPIGLVVVAIAALVAAIIIAYKNSETFRKIVQVVWAAVKVAIKATVDWFVNVAWPFIKRGIDLLVAAFQNYLKIVRVVWGAVFAAINTTWGFIRDRVFNPLKTFITETIPNAFSKGTAAVGRIWDRVKELARKPVDFVVNTVINAGIIDTFNKVSGFFGGPRLPHVSFGDGPGPARRPAAGGFHGFDGYGTGDGPGLLGFLRGPAKWISDRVGLGQLAARFGNHPFIQMLTGMGGKLKDLLVGKAQSLIGELFKGGGGSAGAGGLRSGILAVLGGLRNAFGNVPIISGLRPGARTLTGHLSYHAMGRAIDIAPVHAWAAYLHAVFGRQLRELITPWQEFNILNGRPHTYTGAVWNQHNFAGGNAHIHAAMDRGGWLRPGWNPPIWNGTGRPEPVAPAATLDALRDDIRELIAVARMIGHDVGAELNGAASTMRQLARGR